MRIPINQDAMPPAVLPLFETLTLDEAMSQLVVKETGPDGLVRSVERILADQTVAAKPALVAGLWLYVDQLDRSHRISQGIHNATGSFWHGIMHRREGDFSNSHYWFRKVGDHPAIKLIDDYDPHAFVDQVADATVRGDELPELTDQQRREWLTLFEWCAFYS